MTDTPRFAEFDVVRLVTLRDHRFEGESPFYRRHPLPGDTGTVLEVYATPEPAYYVECSALDGATVWLEILFPDEIAPAGDDCCLQELEGDDWGDPYPDGWRMPERCKALRRTPLTDLTVDDLRLLIGQNIGLEHLLRPALRLLRDDPLLAATYYEGDLLRTVLQSDWHLIRDADAVPTALRPIVERALAQLADPAFETTDAIRQGIADACRRITVESFHGP